MMRRAMPLGIAVVLGAASALTVLATPALAVATDAQIVAALDVATADVVSSAVVGDAAGVAVSSAPIAGFPTNGSDYLIISNGDASALSGDPSTFSSTDLPGAAAGADGNDLTQVKLTLRPPTNATCVAVDFTFLSEEFPEYVGSSFNDIFTAELNETLFSVQGNQVVAPNNFAYDAQNNPVSINTVFGMAASAGTTMDGATPALSATSPVERPNGTTTDLFLSVQDLGDSVYDSAVIVDNVRWLTGTDCAEGATPIADSDADGLPDTWETDGIDYDGDGTPELDLPAMGADPQHRDIFIEVDWMKKDKSCIWFVCWGGKNFAPQQDALRDVVAAFADAPVRNPDNTTGIRMHIDSGPQSVMDPRTNATWGNRSRGGAVPHDEVLGTNGDGGYDWAEFDSVKSANFDLARRDAFHYTLYADRYGADNNGSSGISRGITASDDLITDGHSGWDGGFSRTQERGTFMHELGHGLSLRHGGGDDVNDKQDYLSIMNYLYQLTGLPPGSGLDYSRTGDFIDWDHLRFDGGSIGDLGDSSPPPAVTPVDSLDAETARSLNAFARQGDGIVTFVGPTVLLPKSGVQPLLFDVRNHGSTVGSFTVTLTSSAGGPAGKATASVPAQSVVRLTVPVDTAGLAPGAYDVTAALSGPAGSDLYTDTGTVTVPDTSDPAVAKAAQDAVTQLNALPAGSGLDPAVKTQVAAMVQAVSAPGTAAPWKAAVTMQGTTRVTRTFEVGAPTFVPDATRPTTIKADSAAGAPVLSINLRRVVQGRVVVYAGSLRIAGPKGPVDVKVTGAWDPKKLLFVGAYVGTRQAGTVRIGFTKP